MYKIFVDDKLICISNQRAYEAFCREFREVNAAGGLVCRPLSREEVSTQHPDAKDGITNDGARYLFIRRNGLWDLPKGHQEPGEDIRTTALREVSEETGIPLEQLRIADNTCAQAFTLNATPPTGVDEPGLICVTDHCYKRDGIWHLKHTRWYAMELTSIGQTGTSAGNLLDASPNDSNASPDSPALTPQTEEGISAATWVSPQDIPALLAHAYSSIPEVFRHNKKKKRIIIK